MNSRRFCCLAFALSVGAVRPGTAQVTPLTREATVVQSYDGRSMPAEWLSLQVPARRPNGSGTITLSALRLATTAERPGNPIVFLMGGPGIPGSAMAPIPPYFTLFSRLRELGDVILVDQRGTGRSVPVLDCPFGGQLPDDFLVDRSSMVETMQRQVTACAERWRARGTEPTDYTTLASVADLEDLRLALALPKLDILAFSYGSRLALSYMQQHEPRVGRVVLQAVNGPGLVQRRPAPIDRKLRDLGTLLQRDSAWKDPTDLIGAARAARNRLAGAPTTVEIVERANGQPRKVRIGADGLAALVALNLDDVRLPALLVSVAAGDDRVLTRFVDAAWNGLGGGSVGLMTRAVNCAADRPASRRALIADESRTAVFGNPIDNEFLTDDFCRRLGFREPLPEFARPLDSAVPALLLTGSLDATNPVDNAREVARGLRNATLVDIIHAVHEALPSELVQTAVIQFLRDQSVSERTIVLPPPRFPTPAQVLQAPPPRRGQ